MKWLMFKDSCTEHRDWFYWLRGGRGESFVESVLCRSRSRSTMLLSGGWIEGHGRHLLRWLAHVHLQMSLWYTCYCEGTRVSVAHPSNSIASMNDF